VGQGCRATFDHGFCRLVDVILGSVEGEIVGGVYCSQVEVKDLLWCGMLVVQHAGVLVVAGWGSWSG
jgi:hypothetical protein